MGWGRSSLVCMVVDSLLENEWRICNCIGLQGRTAEPSRPHDPGGKRRRTTMRTKRDRRGPTVRFGGARLVAGPPNIAQRSPRDSLPCNPPMRRRLETTAGAPRRRVSTGPGAGSGTTATAGFPAVGSAVRWPRVDRGAEARAACGGEWFVSLGCQVVKWSSHLEMAGVLRFVPMNSFAVLATIWHVGTRDGIMRDLEIGIRCSPSDADHDD